MSPMKSAAPPARERRLQTRARIIGAAGELVQERSFQELSVADVMGRAGLERTIFYRHFEDLADLLRQASREAIDSLFETELDLRAERDGSGTEAIRPAMQAAVKVYRRHGPLLRALSEAAPVNAQIAEGHAALRRRFDELVVASLREVAPGAEDQLGDIEETARALNMLNEAYLLEAFGHKPRVSTETAVRTLTEIWTAVVRTSS
jgi:TetR/AcrR family transcriptional regulator, ethionamide resistance regulator